MKIDGRILKDLRKEHGLSLRAFAQKIYASKSSVQRWEQTSPPEDVIERIAAVYGLTAEELKSKSDAKYSKDCLSPEKLAELKFGVKGLIIPLVIGLAVSLFAGLAVMVALILL